MIEVVFWGTHNFAVKILEKMITGKIFDIKLVITVPDRPKGRGQKIEKTPIKIIAEQYNLPIVQPENIKKFTLPISNYDLNIIVEYGQIIPQNLIDLPKFGSINIHPSLLPLYRGPSPLQSALVDGKKETGVSLILIDDKMDHGPILAQTKININPEETFLELSEKASVVSGEMLLKTIPNYISGKIKPLPQDDTKAIFCKIINKEDGKINWQDTAKNIFNLYRGLTPWPGLWTVYQGKRLKFLKIKLADKNIPSGQMIFENKEIYVGCGQKSLQIEQIQTEGKKPLSAEEFINGNKNFNGVSFL